MSQLGTIWKVGAIGHVADHLAIELLDYHDAGKKTVTSLISQFTIGATYVKCDSSIVYVTTVAPPSYI